MNGLFQGSWKIGTVMGITIREHFTWLIVFNLIVWSLSSTFYFTNFLPPRTGPRALLPLFSFLLLFYSMSLPILLWQENTRSPQRALRSSPEGIMKFIGESGLVREDDKIIAAEDTSPDSTDLLRIIRFSAVPGGVRAE